MARRKASGPGSNSRRFADIRRPDGSIDRVPAAKDAATYLFQATATGDWPGQFFAKFLYDATWIEDGIVIELEEKRPGHGMGHLTTVQVLEVRARIDIYPNGHAQVRRLVLVTEVPGADDRSGHFSEQYGLEGDEGED